MSTCHTAPRCTTLLNNIPHFATHCNYLPPARSAFRARKQEPWRRPCGSTHCNTLQHTATHCNTLQLFAAGAIICRRRARPFAQESKIPGVAYADQHTATHCNTLQHTAIICRQRNYLPPAQLFAAGALGLSRKKASLGVAHVCVCLFDFFFRRLLRPSVCVCL